MTLSNAEYYKMTSAQQDAREYILSRFGHLDVQGVSEFLGVDPSDAHVLDVINAVFDAIITVRWVE